MQLELVADDRELAERAVEDLLAQFVVALQNESEDGDEHQQQREQRDEAVVGDQCGELPRLVFAELLYHRRHEAHAARLLLTAVEALEGVGDAHGAPPRPTLGCAGELPRGKVGGLQAWTRDIPMCVPDISTGTRRRRASTPRGDPQQGGPTPSRRSRRWRARGAR